MARYNEINVGHFNRFLQKFTGIKGGPPTPQLAGEFQPVVPVFSGVENRYLGSWNLFGNVLAIPAVLVNRSGVAIWNPTGSNVIGVIHRLTWSFSGMGFVVGDVLTVSKGVDTGTFGGGVNPSPNLDLRGGQASQVLKISGQNTPTFPDFPGILWQIQTPAANTTYDLILDEDQQLPILPTDSYRFSAQHAQTQINVNFWWRERYLEESERA